MAVPSSPDDNNHLHKELQPFYETCQPGSLYKFYIGIADEAEEGVWVNINSQKQIVYDNFRASHPRGGRIHNCGHIFPGGDWSDTSCATELCGTCHVDRSEFLYLRGLCFPTEQKMYFRLGGYIEGRPLFRGYFDLIILWEDISLRWLLKSIENNVTMAWFSPHERHHYPIGRHTWTTGDLVCGFHSGTDIALSLSSCPHDMFTCKSGFCLDQRYRCNFRYECLDGSDEDDCGVVVIDSSYRRHLPPRGPQDTTLLLTPTLTLTRIAGIDDISMAVDLEFIVSPTWRDDRLSFNHLHPNTNTLILEEEVKQIWTPKYQLVNLEGGQYELLDETMVVTTSNLPSLPDFNAAKRDFVYPGASNNLSIIHQYTARFTCAFDLYVYPFDVQVCSIDLRLPWTYNDIVEFSRTGGVGSYTGQRDLSLYTVKNVRLNSESGPDQLSLKFELHRRGGLVLLSTFVPSVLLLLVSWATLFVKQEALNVRAIMSLTTLLVLYTLFSNLSSSMPNTAAIKLIDIWFFLIILLLFFNIMVHIFVEFLVHRCSQSTEGAPETIKVSPFGRVFVQRETSTARVERIVSTYRTYIFPPTFLISTVTLGVMMFLI
ncbi:probable ligand-gated ion channel 46 [Homarus americanus]|nr:probable ligand-gated ion channel 46 [Homarus americanus]